MIPSDPIQQTDMMPEVLEENRVLKEEIRISREAAEVTAKLVVKQFEETEQILQRYQTANALREAVLNSATHISIIATDADGIINVFNSGAENLLGYTAKEMVHKKRPEIFHLPSELSWHAEKLGRRLNREIPPGKILYEYANWEGDELAEWTYVRKDGTRVPVVLSITPLRAPDHTIGGYLGIAHDISKRKQAEKALREAHDDLENRVKVRTAELARANEELHAKIAEHARAQEALRKSEEKFRSVFENASNGFFQSTPEGRFLAVNPAMARMLGYDSPEETIESIVNIREQVYVHPEDRTKLIELSDREGRVSDFQTQYRRRDGRVIDVSISGITVKDGQGKALYYEAAVEDITQKKQAEKLKIEKEAAEAATQAKSSFLANMSHEIRTPMNAVIGLTELALKTELTDKQRDYLSKIHGSSHALLGIINDILDFSKIEAGKLEMEQVVFLLDDVLNNLSDMFTEKVTEKGIELVLFAAKDVPRTLVGDPLRLGQILINLVNNAVKFTHRGQIVVTAVLIKKANNRVRLRFSVKDSGIGISREYLPYLFSSFTQADDTTTREYGGTGLGLTISRRLVNMMGGEIQVESEEGVGATFHFTAEFDIKNGARQKRSIVPPVLQAKRILVVDNNETSREVFSEILKSFAFRPTAVGSGEAALRELAAKAGGGEDYAMVLLDWRMPEMDGITTLREIRQTIGISDIPVVMMTAYGREEVIQRAESAGADAFLIKPVKQSILFDTIMNIFHQTVPESPPALCPGAEHPLGDRERLSGRRVLLVEDNPINQQVATEILQGAGMIVDLANNGKEAVQAVGTVGYDAVLMDVQMPEMDGYEASRRIRADGRFRHLPIIAMTAHAMKGDREKCLKAGMNDYVTKPIHTHELFGALKRWMTPDKVSARDEARQNAPAEMPGPAFPENLPGIDVAAALKRIQNKTLFKNLLVEFAENYHSVVRKIARAIETGDRECAIRHAHTVKGIAGNFSAMDLFDAAQDLETAIPRENKEEMAESLSRFQAALDRVIASARQLSVKSPEEDNRDAAGAGGPAEAVMRNLATLLKRNDFQAEECFAALRRKLDATHHQEMETLSLSIKNLDFESASIQLLALARNMNIPLDGGADD